MYIFNFSNKYIQVIRLNMTFFVYMCVKLTTKDFYDSYPHTPQALILME